VKALIYLSHDDIRIEQRSVPAISDHELLVRVHGCGLCGSDILKIVQRAAPPVVLGHELTGTVVRRGDAVVQFKEGQRVIVAHHVPCGECHYCRHHNYSMCPSFKASNIDPCGLAEYIRVPAEHVRQTTLLLPEALSAEEGSFTEPLACCLRAVRRTPLLDGDCIVIMGLGSIGLLMLQAVRAWGARAGYTLRVYGVDLLPARLQLARDLGADDAFLAPAHEHELRDLLLSLTEGRGADSVFITTAGERPFLQALACVRKGGIVQMFAAHSGVVLMNIEHLYQQELSIISTYSSSPEDLHLALDLLTQGAVRVERLISHRLPLERFHEGVQLMREHAALKVYFQISEDQISEDQISGD
jgi:L-iditol 2-dehydrogenase